MSESPQPRFDEWGDPIRTEAEEAAMRRKISRDVDKMTHASQSVIDKPTDEATRNGALAAETTPTRTYAESSNGATRKSVGGEKVSKAVAGERGRFPNAIPPSSTGFEPTGSTSQEANNTGTLDEWGDRILSDAEIAEILNGTRDTTAGPHGATTVKDKEPKNGAPPTQPKPDAKPLKVIDGGAQWGKFLDTEQEASNTGRPDADHDDESGSSPPNDERICTDLGNADRFVARFGHQFRYTPGIGWLVWDGRRWSPDDEKARQAAITTIRSIFDEARQAKSIEMAKRLSAWAITSRSAGRAEALLTLARVHPKILTKVSSFDRNPRLLNVLNGTLNLDTGAMRNHDPEDLITKLAPVLYSATAESKLWDDFVAEVTAGQDGLNDFLRRAAGYTLSGETIDDAVFILHGPGGTGKSTAVSALQDIMGDYASSLRSEALTEKQSSGHSDDIARLVGVRMAIVVEASENDRMREGLLKSLSGGDTVSASFKGRTGFQFDPQLKLWFATNSVPRLSANDTGVWRRIYKLPFLNKLATPDKRLAHKLKEPRVRSAILAWAVKGYQEWHRVGLQPPESVTGATEQLRQSMDGLVEFCEDSLDFSDPRTTTSFQEVWQTYLDWAADTRRRTVSPRTLTDSLTARGAIPDRSYIDGKRIRVWRGVLISNGTHGTDGTALSGRSLMKGNSGNNPEVVSHPSHPSRNGSERGSK